MANAFLGDEDGAAYSGEVRVFVNNMNTRHATVTLPERKRHQTFNDGHGNAFEMDGNIDAGSPFRRRGTVARRSVASYGGAGTGAGAVTVAPSPVITVGQGKDSKELHSNLRQLYARLMRRLQSQLHYSEINRIPLYQQYGIDMDLIRGEIEDGEEDVTSTRSHSIRRLDETRSLSQYMGSVGSLAPLTNQTDEEKTPVGGITVSELGGRRRIPSSRITQFNRTNDDVATQTTKEEKDEESDITMQPCSKPLRLVVQHVKDTVTKKMDLCESGSLKDCIVYAFECRALLDRLLKEIPTYSHYSPEVGAVQMRQQTNSVASTVGTGGLGTTVSRNASPAAALVTSIGQKLRNQPVFLPRGTYVQETTTGTLHAELRNGISSSPLPTDAMSHGNSTYVTLPALGESAPRTVNNAPSAPFENRVAQGTTGNGLNGLPDVPLPANYGKSVRLAAAAAQKASAIGAAETEGAVEEKRGTPWQKLRNHLGDAVNADAMQTSEGGEQVTTATAGEEGGDYDSGEGGTGRPGSGKVKSGMYSNTARACRVTQHADAGTLTDENAMTTVPLAEYQTLQQRIRQLEVEVADVQFHRNAIADQLCEQAQYTDQKRHILQYLRETLVRECSMLRSQLAMATQKNQQLQRTIHAQAMMPPPTSNGVNGGGGGGGGNGGGLNHTPSLASMARGMNPHSTIAATPYTGGPLSSSMMINPTATPRRSPAGSITAGLYPDPSAVMTAAGPDESMISHGGGGGLHATPHHMSLMPRWTRSQLAGGSIVGEIGGSTSSTTLLASDVNAIQSLIDLALLAVEKDSVLSCNPSAIKNMDRDEVVQEMRKEGQDGINEVRSDYTERMRVMRKEHMDTVLQLNFLLSEREQEIKRLQDLYNLDHVHSELKTQVKNLRNEVTSMRFFVEEQLHAFQSVLNATGKSVLSRTVLVDGTMRSNIVLQNTINALNELVESASNLFLPMLTREYECGYHPWPMKLRNMADPLAHVIHLRYGAAEVSRLRPELGKMSKVYIALHQYVTKHAVVPETMRPSVGAPLRMLCSALALNPMSHTDVIFAARRHYEADGQLAKRIARVNIQILWNTYRQRTYTNNSIAAMVEAQLDPRLGTLPVAGRVNALAVERGELLQKRAALQRRRVENSKEVYRLWTDKDIDIMEGYPTPQVHRNRLAMLSNQGT